MLRSSIGRIHELLHVFAEPFDLLIVGFELVQLRGHVRSQDADGCRVSGQSQLDAADIFHQAVHMFAMA